VVLALLAVAACNPSSKRHSENTRGSTSQPAAVVAPPVTATVAAPQPVALVPPPVIAPDRPKGQAGTSGASDVSVASLAGIVSGDYRCRLAELPSKLPDYEFRCRVSRKPRGVIQLVSLDGSETSLSLGEQADRTVYVSGQVFIPGRNLDREYDQRWVKLFGKLAPTTPSNHLLTGQVRALVQSYGEWAAPQVNEATREPMPRGTHAKVRFELVSKLEGSKN
jgi:hypothetical protein